MPDGTVTAVWDSHADWYLRGPYKPFLTELRLPGAAPVRMLHLRQPGGRFFDPATPDFVLSVVLGGGDASGRLDLGAGRFGSQGIAGEFALAPPGTACDYEVRGPHEVLALSLPGASVLAILAEVAGTCLSDHGPLHAAMQRDAGVESVVRRLWAAAAEDNPMGALLAEDAATAIAARLACLAMRANGQVDMSKETPPLHGARLTRVLGRIEDQLDADLRQADLAAAAGLSPWHFCRAFKAATGVAPHRFVLLRRLARVQWLLRTTKLGLAEVAVACGFSSHAHLTTAFTREVGATPSDWRQEAGSR